MQFAHILRICTHHLSSFTELLLTSTGQATMTAEISTMRLDIGDIQEALKNHDSWTFGEPFCVSTGVCIYGGNGSSRFIKPWLNRGDVPSKWGCFTFGRKHGPVEPSGVFHYAGSTLRPLLEGGFLSFRTPIITDQHSRMVPHQKRKPFNSVTVLGISRLSAYKVWLSAGDVPVEKPAPVGKWFIPGLHPSQVQDGHVSQFADREP